MNPAPPMRAPRHEAGMTLVGVMVSATERPTADPDLRAVTIAVAAREERVPLAILDGFVDAGTTTP